MIATWLGGPYDGRSDELPNGTHAVSVAHPLLWIPWMDTTEYPTRFVEVKCEIVNTARGWVIVWHEP